MAHVQRIVAQREVFVALYTEADRHAHTHAAVLAVATRAAVRSQRVAHLAEARFFEAVNRMAIEGPLVTGEAVRAVDCALAKIDWLRTQGEQIAQIRLDLLTYRPRGRAMAAITCELLVPSVHPAGRRELSAPGQQQTGQDRYTNSAANSCTEMPPRHVPTRSGHVSLIIRYWSSSRSSLLHPGPQKYVAEGLRCVHPRFALAEQISAIAPPLVLGRSTKGSVGMQWLRSAIDSSVTRHP